MNVDWSFKCLRKPRLFSHLMHRDYIISTMKCISQVSSYHAWDASCQAAEVAGLAVGALLHPLLPQWEQQHGPDLAWVWDVGSGVIEPSSLPGCGDNTQSKPSDGRNPIMPLSVQRNTHKKVEELGTNVGVPWFQTEDIQVQNHPST